MNQYKKLNKDLFNLGVPNNENVGIIGNSIDTLVNTKLSSKPYIDILIEYLPNLDGNELEMVIRAISEKGNRKASPYLIELFKNSKINNSVRWTVGNALNIIDDPDTYPEIIQICKNNTYGWARQMLFITLARIKTEESYNLLISSLKEPLVKGQIIEALGKFGNPEAIPILEKTSVEKGKYEYKAKQTALRRLNINKDNAP